MIFQEPRVEFIKLQLADMITDTSGNQSTVTQCGGKLNDEDCEGGAQFNY